MKHIGLFEGIGGFSLAARWMGWETIAWCEWNEFCQKILSYHFPNAKKHGDISTTDFSVYRGQCDLLTGGFPCQPFSGAGKRKGKEDNRFLWPEMLRAIKEIQPTWVVAENVFGIINQGGGMVFEQVQTEMENEGYEVQSYLLPACAVNAPHRRDRFWFIAYRNGKQTEQRKQKIKRVWDGFTASGKRTDVANTKGGGLERQGEHREVSNSKRNIGAVCANEGTIINDDNNTGGIGWDKGGHVNGHFENREKGRQLCSTDSPHNWSEWPTQPPIRFRDDGVSSQLDGITLSKWITESIKSAGNAIVPQVAFEIFKVIQQMQNEAK